MTVGSLAAYALSRFSFRPRLLTIIVFILGMAGAIVTVALRRGLAACCRRSTCMIVVASRLAEAPSPSLANSDVLFWMISQRILPPVVAAIPIP
jgi:multiple sugar transport system permease protein